MNIRIILNKIQFTFKHSTAFDRNRNSTNILWENGKSYDDQTFVTVGLNLLENCRKITCIP